MKIMPGKVAKVVGGIVDSYKSKALIIMGRGNRVCPPIEVKVKIPAKGDTPIIIGREPIFELYRITFIEAEKYFIMEPYKKSKK